MAKQETVQAIEETLDTIEETLETLERIPNVNLNGTTHKQQILILSVVAGAGLLVGAGGAYAILKGKLSLRRKKKHEVNI